MVVSVARFDPWRVKLATTSFDFYIYAPVSYLGALQSSSITCSSRQEYGNEAGPKWCFSNKQTKNKQHISINYKYQKYIKKIKSKTVNPSFAGILSLAPLKDDTQMKRWFWQAQDL